MTLLFPSFSSFFYSAFISVPSLFFPLAGKRVLGRLLFRQGVLTVLFLAYKNTHEREGGGGEGEGKGDGEEELNHFCSLLSGSL